MKHVGFRCAALEITVRLYNWSLDFSHAHTRLLFVVFPVMFRDIVATSMHVWFWHSGLHTLQCKLSAQSAKCRWRHVILLNYLPLVDFFKNAALASVFCKFLCKVFTWWNLNHLCQLTGSMLFNLSWALESDNGSEKDRSAFSCLRHKTNHIRSTLRSNTWDKMLI